MKVRTKISLLYTLITFFVLSVSFALAYFIVKRYNENLFFKYLSEKALITAEKYFEKDEVNDAAYNNILKKYSQLLPDEEEIVLNANNPLLKDSLTCILSLNQINRLLIDSTLTFTLNKYRQGFGLYYHDNEGDFVVLITAFDKQGNALMGNLFSSFLVILFISVVFSFLIGYVYAGNILYPLKHILKTVDHIRTNNLNIRLKERRGSDELASLINMLNRMLERLQNGFESQKSFIANASHELNNPLTAILGETEIILARERDQQEYVNALFRISEEAGRMDIMIRNLINLARADAGFENCSFEDIDFISVLDSAIATIEKKGYKGRLVVNISNDCNNEIIFKGNFMLLCIAITNVIENACKYSFDKPVNVTLKKIYCGVEFVVSDKGIGIPEMDCNKIFCPFFRAENARYNDGNGIGLALTEKIVKLHNGNITVSSVINEGTIVTILFTCS